MLRHMLPAVLVAAFALAAHADDPKKADPPKKAKGPLADARTRLLHGNYAEAREEYEKAAKADDKLKPLAAVGIAESHRLVGEHEKALAILTDALKAAADSPPLLAARADLLYALGKWDDADKDIAAAVAADPNCLHALYLKACLQRDHGDTDAADKTFRSVVKYYTAQSNADKDITDPDELLWVAQCGAENARWHNLSKQFAFILNTVLKDALKEDPQFWPAEQLAGELLLEKYNRPDAIEAFDNALKINPKAADPLVGKAHAALMKYELKEADALADQALKQNPRHPAALRVKAEVLGIAGDYPAAEKLLLAAKDVNPRDPDTLGRLAAVYFLQNKTEAFDAAVKGAAEFDAKPGQFYFELATCLDERKRYPQAEVYYKKAAELRPMLSGPRTGLGMLYLRLGNEAEGRKLLDAAQKADPFNVRVANTRKVLDHLTKYAAIETDHYTLKYDPESGTVLARWMADYLEETHADLKRQYGFEPSGKILIEVFNSHQMFSGRTVGLPDLHTVGACIGSVVAMASPQAKELNKPYNWGRVVRHELTHVFNLAQTDYQCPHWLTEGLGVQNERMNRPPDWTRILRERFASDTLLNLDTITLGFVRPKDHREWTLAYCQSQLYVDYLIKTYGQGAVGKVLNEYRAGKGTAAALKAACGVEKAAFEAGYKEYVAGIVKAAGGASAEKAADVPMTFEELEAAVEKDPKDWDAKAKLAEQLFRRNKATEAKKLADEVLEKVPGHPVAAVVRARLLARGGDEDAAAEALAAAVKAKPDDPKLLLAVGRMYAEKKDYDKAAAAFEKGRKLAPLDADWLEALAKVYKESKDTAKLAGVLREVVGHDPDELDGRVRLAKLCLEDGNPADAAAFALDALHIDVNHAEAKDVLLAALKKQGKAAEIEAVEKRCAK